MKGRKFENNFYVTYIVLKFLSKEVGEGREVSKSREGWKKGESKTENPEMFLHSPFNKKYCIPSVLCVNTNVKLNSMSGSFLDKLIIYKDSGI